LNIIPGLVRSRGHKQAYIANKVLVYSEFLTGFVGIYMGIVRLGRCPCPSRYKDPFNYIDLACA